MEFQGRYKKDGFDFDKNRDRILRHAEFNIGKRFILSDFIPESKKQRGFFEGAIIPLWVYLDGYDHKDSIKLKQYHDYAKQEFNPEFMLINGKSVKMGASTKGKLNGDDGIIEKTIDNLESNYGISRIEVLDPKKYKHWKDKVFPYGGPDDYIDYLVETVKLKVVEKQKML